MPPILISIIFSFRHLWTALYYLNRHMKPGKRRINLWNVRGLKIGVIQHQQSCVGTWQGWVATYQIFVPGSNHVSIMCHTFEHLCAKDLKKRSIYICHQWMFSQCSQERGEHQLSKIFDSLATRVQRGAGENQIDDPEVNVQLVSCYDGQMTTRDWRTSCYDRQISIRDRRRGGRGGGQKVMCTFSVAASVWSHDGQIWSCMIIWWPDMITWWSDMIIWWPDYGWEVRRKCNFCSQSYQGKPSQRSKRQLQTIQPI